MTTWQALRAIRRRWYVAVLGLLVTMVLGVWVHGMPGVYWTVADVYFVAPQSPSSGQIGEPSGALVATAGLVEREVNIGAQETGPVSPDVSIVGMGIYNGTYIQLPNFGGQWAYDFSEPLLQISASAPTAAQAAAKRDEAIQRVRAKLLEIQNANGVPRSAQITTNQVPDAPQVAYDQGRPTRALGVLVILGSSLTAAACVFIDGLILRRHRRRATSTSGPRLARASA